MAISFTARGRMVEQLKNEKKKKFNVFIRYVQTGQRNARCTLGMAGDVKLHNAVQREGRAIRIKSLAEMLLQLLPVARSHSGVTQALDERHCSSKCAHLTER